MSEAPKSADTIERLQKVLVYALIAIVAILVLVVAMRMMRDGTEVTDSSLFNAPTATASSNEQVVALLANARAAMAKSQLVSPAGDNAYEAYLAVIEVDPANRSAREAINDLYGIAVSSTEQAIVSGDFADAARLAELLARANPDSFTVNNLRQRIERGQALVAAAEQQAAAQQQARSVREQAAVEPAATADEAETEALDAAVAATDEPATIASPASVPAVAETESAAPPSVPSANAAVAAASAPTPMRTTRTTVSAPSAGGSQAPVVREARLLSRVDPEYPAEAMRSRQQGWVEVEFTIDTAGRVGNAQVIGSRPSRIFDRAAIRAIQGWRFEPRMENGQAVASRLRQRFDFRVD